jgi:hypothetical protein
MKIQIPMQNQCHNSREHNLFLKLFWAIQMWGVDFNKWDLIWEHALWDSKILSVTIIKIEERYSLDSSALETFILVQLESISQCWVEDRYSLWTNMASTVQNLFMKSYGIEFIDWIRNRKISLTDFILTCLAISRKCFLWTTMSAISFNTLMGAYFSLRV